MCVRVCSHTAGGALGPLTGATGTLGPQLGPLTAKPAFTQTRSCKVAIAEKGWVIYEGSGEGPLGQGRCCFPSVEHVTASPRRQEKEGPPGPQAVVEAILRTPHPSGRGQAEKPDAHCHPDIFRLPGFRMSFQPGSCPPS